MPSKTVADERVALEDGAVSEHSGGNGDGGRPRIARPPGGRRRLRVAGVGAVLVVVVLAAALGVVLSGGHGSGELNPPPAPNSALGEVVTPSKIISEPQVLPGKNVDFVYSSGLGGPINIPLVTYSKLGQWSRVYNPMPQMPSWVQPTLSTFWAPVWSPDVRQVGSHYVMWYSAIWDGAPPYRGEYYPRCLGWAVASSPYGPFRSSGNHPALCQVKEFGDIDPRTFTVGHQEWLIWKSDDNGQPQLHVPTKIWVQRLGTDGHTLVGSPVAIYHNDKPWQGAIVESPDMVKAGSRYYLFYSANASGSPGSGIGLAVCRSPEGPCTSPSAGPWLGSNTNGQGPDEESLFQQGGATWLVYTPHATYYDAGFPDFAISRVAFGPHGPYVASFAGSRPEP